MYNNNSTSTSTYYSFSITTNYTITSSTSSTKWNTIKRVVEKQVEELKKEGKINPNATKLKE